MVQNAGLRCPSITLTFMSCYDKTGCRPDQLSPALPSLDKCLSFPILYSPGKTGSLLGVLASFPAAYDTVPWGGGNDSGSPSGLLVQRALVYKHLAIRIMCQRALVWLGLAFQAGQSLHLVMSICPVSVDPLAHLTDRSANLESSVRKWLENPQPSPAHAHEHQAQPKPSPVKPIAHGPRPIKFYI